MPIQQCEQSANECGQNANKGGLPWWPPTGHLPLVPVTLMSQWRIKNPKELTLDLNIGVLKNQEAGGREWTKCKKQQGNCKQATREKLRGNGLNAHAQSDHLLTTGNLPVNYDCCWCHLSLKHFKSCWVKTILVGGIKQLGISLSCIFFSFLLSWMYTPVMLIVQFVAKENAWSPSLNDSPVKWGVEFCLSLSFVFFAHSTYSHLHC